MAKYRSDIMDPFEEMFIDLKILPEYFEVQLLGLKTFEIRKQDGHNFIVGEYVRLNEWDNSINDYTGRSITRVITFVTDYAQKDGYVVFGTKPI